MTVFDVRKKTKEVEFRVIKKGECFLYQGPDHPWIKTFNGTSAVSLLNGYMCDFKPEDKVIPIKACVSIQD